MYTNSNDGVYEHRMLKIQGIITFIPSQELIMKGRSRKYD
jgi:hypothetical protein